MFGPLLPHNARRPMGTRGPRYRLWRVWHQRLALVTEHLIQLTSSNRPLQAGLLAMAPDAPDRQLRESLYALSHALEEGETLHAALGRQPAFFPSFYVDMVRVGEETATLPTVLEELHDLLARGLDMRERIWDQVAYLLFVLAYTSAVGVFLILFVMPQFMEISSMFRAQAPPLMGWVYTAGEWGIPQWLLCMALVLPVAFYLFDRSAWRGRGTASALLPLLPVAGRITEQRRLALASMALEKLLGAGVPLPQALLSAATAQSSARISRVFGAMSRAIEQGESFTDALRRHARKLPRSFTSLAAIGEASGMLPESLGHLGEHYHRLAQRNARVALDIAAPIALACIGLLVFIVYAAFFQAIIALPRLVEIPLY